MWKRKWFIPVVLLPLLLAGSIAGGVVAATDNTTKNQSQPADGHQTLLERVCVIYEENTGVAIDPGQLKDVLTQARSEMQGEALQSWLQKLVDDGKITQEEADQYLEWWQARPGDTLGLGLRLGMKSGRALGDWGGPC